MKYYSAIKGYESLLFVTIWMEMKIRMSSEISQAQKDKDHIHLCESMTSLICGAYPDLYTTQCKQGSKYHTMPYEHAQFLCS